ncbi:hypothetical protein BJ508DRAFT_313370 [Ascobolus immersus RN42]|uniref:Uncharacterized protein n=1 Tax=Ascobolus immersus RN42 TaxID=1160509 RepID=A0A3N4HJ21_ASCIM|nr:hypothetical protein BJ508DRAFT_313370 [Ascobolus immersus RN42]
MPPRSRRTRHSNGHRSGTPWCSCDSEDSDSSGSEDGGSPLPPVVRRGRKRAAPDEAAAGRPVKRRGHTRSGGRNGGRIGSRSVSVKREVKAEMKEERMDSEELYHAPGWSGESSVVDTSEVETEGDEGDETAGESELSGRSTPRVGTSRSATPRDGTSSGSSRSPAPRSAQIQRPSSSLPPARVFARSYEEMQTLFEQKLEELCDQLEVTHNIDGEVKITKGELARIVGVDWSKAYGIVTSLWHCREIMARRCIHVPGVVFKNRFPKEEAKRLRRVRREAARVRAAAAGVGRPERAGSESKPNGTTSPYTTRDATPPHDPRHESATSVVVRDGTQQPDQASPVSAPQIEQENIQHQQRTADCPTLAPTLGQLSEFLEPPSPPNDTLDTGNRLEIPPTNGSVTVHHPRKNAELSDSRLGAMVKQLEQQAMGAFLAEHLRALQTPGADLKASGERVREMMEYHKEMVKRLEGLFGEKS